MQSNISINLKKKKANYKRTSSGGQDLELQINSNAEFIKQYDEEDVLEFTDFDVSATNLLMNDRPALNRMFKLIRQGMIDTVIVYERERLARNVLYAHLIPDEPDEVAEIFEDALKAKRK